MSLNELVAVLDRGFGRTFNPPYADWRPGDQRVFVADVRKAQRLLGWSPKVRTVEGVEKLLGWVRENRALFALSLRRRRRPSRADPLRPVRNPECPNPACLGPDRRRVFLEQEPT